MASRDTITVALLSVALLFVPMAAGSVEPVQLTALKLDVLCRGGHGSEKLERHALWCQGYARGIRDTLRTLGEHGVVSNVCTPADEHALWQRFGAWLVANPDERDLTARDAVLRALSATPCS